MHAPTACAVIALTLCASSGFADEMLDTPMAPDAFRALVEGKTLHYSHKGTYYGSERFYGQDRVTWQAPSGTCQDGLFWDVKDALCFRYTDTSCWRVFEPSQGKRFAVSKGNIRVHIELIDKAPLRCAGAPIS